MKQITVKRKRHSKRKRAVKVTASATRTVTAKINQYRHSKT